MSPFTDPLSQITPLIINYWHLLAHIHIILSKRITFYHVCIIIFVTFWHTYLYSNLSKRITFYHVCIIIFFPRDLQLREGD